jgi:DNA-binding transcriptional MerR regulator
MAQMRTKKTLNQRHRQLKTDSEYFAPINTVSRELGIPAHTLRYWEKQFPTVVRPTTGAGGRRYYRAETVERLKTIQDLLYNRGMTIAGVKKMIRGGEFTAQPPVQTVAEPEPRSASVAALDTTKIDLAIGLLNQARELLK